MYYVNKAFHDSKLNYSQIEKLAYSLLMASPRLRQYFQSHHIIILIDQFLKKVLQKMITSGRMVKQSIELSEYSLEFNPRQYIEAQALADFVVECSFYSFQNQNHQEQLVVGSSSYQVTPKNSLIYSQYTQMDHQHKKVQEQEYF